MFSTQFKLGTAVIFVACVLILARPWQHPLVQDRITSLQGWVGLGPACPDVLSPWIQRPGLETTMPALSGPDVHCEPLASASPDFAIELCRSPRVCHALDLIVRRTDHNRCAIVEGNMRVRPVSNDSSLAALVRERVGPDAFYILVDGSERLGLFRPDEYMGNCQYRFSLGINNPGYIQVQMWHHYENYSVFNENSYDWPIVNLTKSLFDPPLTVPICPSCPSRVVPPSPLNSTVLASTKPPAPPCSRTEPVYGAFLPSTYLARHPPSEFGLPSLPNEGDYAFVPANGCAFVEAGGRYADHAACFRPPHLNVLYVGDSHMRVAYDGLVHRLRGRQWSMDESEKQGHKNASFPERYLEFQWDPTGLGLLTQDCSDLATFDIIAVEIGHHLHPGTTADYITRLQDVLEHLSHLANTCARPGKEPVRLVYVSPPCMAPRDDHFVKEIKDRRTNVRMDHWAKLGLDMAKERGWRTVDMFTVTKGFVRDTKDAAHFMQTDAMDPIVDDIVTKLGICE